MLIDNLKSKEEAYEVFPQVSSYLIAHGADVNAEHRYGGTTLRVALKHRHKRIADLLTKAGTKLYI